MRSALLQIAAASLLLGTVACDTAPNEAALAYAGYTFNRILGHGWLP